MADQGKNAGLPAGGPFAGIAADRETQNAGGAIRETDATAAVLPGARGGLSEHTRNRIAAQLRTMYDTVAQQPVPDRFAELIAKLDSGKA